MTLPSEPTQALHAQGRYCGNQMCCWGAAGEKAPTPPSELDQLVANVNPRAKLPRGFAMWSEKLTLAWLRQNQKKPKKKKEK